MNRLSVLVFASVCLSIGGLLSCGDATSSSDDSTRSPPDTSCSESGKHRCSGPAVQQCRDSEGDGELKWETIEDCSDRGGCTNASCNDPLTKFAGEATRWSVPRGDEDGNLDDAVTSRFDRYYRWYPEESETGWLWDTLDVTGDGLEDLVATGAYDGNDPIASFGNSDGPHWRVYPGREDGFADEPIAWQLPEGGSGGGSSYWRIWTAAGFEPETFQDNPDHRHWTTADIVGDDRMDLVVTSELTDDGEVRTFGSGADRHWYVYEGREGGFASEPIEWDLPSPPDGAGPNGFHATQAVTSDETSAYWELRDLTRNGGLDLVVTARAGAEDNPRAFGSQNNRHWKVYEWTPDGFATEASRWHVPAVETNPERGIWRPDNRPGPQSRTQLLWSVQHVTGGPRPDLIHDGDGNVPLGDDGNRHWEVYEATADGFADEPSRWTLPTDGVGAADLWETNSGFHGLVSEFRGPARPALVVTGTSTGDGIKKRAFGGEDNRHWNVFPIGPDGFSDEPVAWPLPSGGQKGRGFHQLSFGMSSFIRPDALQDTDIWAIRRLDDTPGFKLLVTARGRNDRLQVRGTPEQPYWKVYDAVP